MADKKISQLTGASLPLAGTEVLPIVQSNQTVKVAADDLTVKNIRSNATTGLLQIAGPGAAATRVMTVPDANFTSARTDAANSFSGNQTLSTGNLIIGTAGKGVAFANNTITEDKVSAYKKSASTTIAASAGRSDLYFNVLTNQTFTTTAAGFGGLVTITTGDGVAATFFWSWNSATITILATGSALFAATSTPSATEIGIFKSASSNTFSVKNGTASTKAITICFVGDYAASTTDPA